MPNRTAITEEALERARALTASIEEAIESALIDGDVALAAALNEIR